MFSGVCNRSLWLCLFDPAAQQPPDFGYHLADMFVLPQRQPAPAVDEAQIETEFVEVGIRLAQMAQPDFVLPGLGFQQRFLKIKGAAHQSLGDGATVQFGKLFGFGQ